MRIKGSGNLWKNPFVTVVDSVREEKGRRGSGTLKLYHYQNEQMMFPGVNRRAEENKKGQEEKFSRIFLTLFPDSAQNIRE